MGTNYYLRTKDACPTCGHVEAPLHIGKSSAGWVFALHAIPEKGLTALDDWRKAWNAPGARIEDEYGREVSTEAMLATILHRQWAAKAAKPNTPLPHGIMQGPNGLLRAVPTGRTAHGPGTYDIILGDFS